MHSLGIPLERISMTFMTVDNNRWLQAAAVANSVELRRAWGAKPKSKIILFCAKLQSWKRPLDLLRAFASAAIPDSILVFAGDGPQRPELETATKELSIEDRVRFLGFVNQSCRKFIKQQT